MPLIWECDLCHRSFVDVEPCPYTLDVGPVPDVEIWLCAECHGRLVAAAATEPKQ